jgi:single-strand DNA-binding protein
MTIEVALFGVLGRDAESKTSKNGKPYLRLNVRCGDGDAVQWISAMIFGDDVPDAARLEKGSRVYLEGSLKLNEWTAQDGTKRHSLSVMSWHCKLAAIGRNRPTKRESSDSEQRPESHSSDTRVRGTADRDLDDEIPF